MSQNNLKRIEVSGFKSIEHLSLEMEDINILVGANGAGKSNFISLFTFLNNLSRATLRNYIEKSGGAETFFHFGTKTTSLFTIDVNIGNNGYYGDFVQNIANDGIVISREYCKWPYADKTVSLLPSGGESGISKAAERAGIVNYTKYYLDQCRVYHFHDTSSTASFKKTQNVDDNSYLFRDAKNIAPYLLRLKSSTLEEERQSYQTIVTAIHSIAPFFRDFYLVPSGEEGNKNVLLRWLHTNHEDPFSANHLSDGTARFICMAVLFLQPISLRPDTIILDEPELGLHPAALVALADIIKSISSETQVICSTQSITFANQFEAKAFIVVDAKDGVSAFHRPDAIFLENWLDEYGMGDIWAKNLIGGRPQ